MTIVIRLTYILQLEVGTFTIAQRLVFFQRNLLIQTIVVSSVVGDIQLTITTHQRQVTTTIESTSMLRTNSNEVVVIDIIKRSSGITEYRCGIAIALTVRRHVTSGKHSIVDMYATLYLVVIRFTARIKVRPTSICLVSRQGVQIIGRHIIVWMISFLVIPCRWIGYVRTVFPNLQHRSDYHFAVFCQFLIGIIIIIVVRRTGTLIMRASKI